MKALVYKKYNLFFNFLKFNTRIALAYKANFYAGLVSTLSYTFIYILLINVIYSNTNSLAGYNQNQMTFFFFIGQVQVFLLFTLRKGIVQLVQDIHLGKLDLIVTKPMPHLFYYYFGFVDPVTLIRNSLPPLLLIGYSIEWVNLALNIENIIVGIIFFVLGQIVLFNVLYIVSFSVFYLKKSEEIFGAISEFGFSANSIVPHDLMPKNLQIAIISIIPVAFAVGIPAAILLDKISWQDYAIPLLLAIVGTELLKRYLWNFSLKKYSSASS